MHTQVADGRHDRGERPVRRARWCCIIITGGGYEASTQHTKHSRATPPHTHIQQADRAAWRRPLCCVSSGGRPCPPRSPPPPPPPPTPPSSFSPPPPPGHCSWRPLPTDHQRHGPCPPPLWRVPRRRASWMSPLLLGTWRVVVEWWGGRGGGGEGVGQSDLMRDAAVDADGEEAEHDLHDIWELMNGARGSCPSEPWWWRRGGARRLPVMA